MTSNASDELDWVLFSAIEAMPLGAIVTETDGRILYINKTFSAVSGHGPEVIGRTPGFLRSGHQPKDFYRRLWAKITAGQIWDAEVVNRRKDGTEYPARHIIVPIKDATGKIIHFVGFQEDLTEIKRKTAERAAIEETLTRERERAQVTLNSIADAVICSDIAGNITYLNTVAERLTGWPREEAAGRPRFWNWLLELELSAEISRRYTQDRSVVRPEDRCTARRRRAGDGHNQHSPKSEFAGGGRGRGNKGGAGVSQGSRLS